MWIKANDEAHARTLSGTIGYQFGDWYAEVEPPEVGAKYHRDGVQQMVIGHTFNRVITCTLNGGMPKIFSHCCSAFHRDFQCCANTETTSQN